MKCRAALAVGALAVVLAGCAAGSATGHTKTVVTINPSVSPAAAATKTGPSLTGFGATLAQWQAAHSLDRTVPARDAYLPHIGPDGQDTWEVVTVAGGRVISYTLNVPPSSLKAAEARARRELPADARVLWTRTGRGSYGNACSQVQFQSATLAAALGDGQVNVEFDNAITANARPITEELFSTWNAPTVAKAPAC
jgi:hypothetical protein